MSRFDDGLEDIDPEDIDPTSLKFNPINHVHWKLRNDRLIPPEEKMEVDEKAIGCALGLWILGVLLSLGLTATVIWAIIKLVQHFIS